MDHMVKPGVLMPSPTLSAVSNISNNSRSSTHHHHRISAAAAGVGVLSPTGSSASSSSAAQDRCRCTLCNYVGLDDNDLHRHFREIHWQQVLIMHQQRQEILNGAAKPTVKSPPIQKYPSAEQPSSANNNILISSIDSNIELDESIVAAANTILSISASNNAAIQNQRRNTMTGCAQNFDQSTSESSDFARPRLATLSAMPNNLTNGVYHNNSKDQVIRQVDLPSSEESQLLRKMQQQHPSSLAAIAELAEYSSQAQQPQQANNFSLELLLQQQQLLLSQQNELNPLRSAALAELRAVLASHFYATLQQQQQQQPIAATSQQAFLPLNQQQNAGSIASAQNFWPHQNNGGGCGDTMTGNAVAAVGHQTASNSLSDDLQSSLQQHIREQQQQPYPSYRRHSIIPAVNSTPIRPTVSQSHICHQGRSESQISTTTPVTINTYATAISTAPSSTSTTAPASLTLRSPEEITQHISRIISENEAILEPSPILTKRRYTRQLNGPIPVQQPQQSGNNSNLSSPNANGPREYRSNSLYSSFSPASIQRQNSFGGGGGHVAFCRPNVVKLGQQSPIAMNACSSATLSPSFNNNILVNTRGTGCSSAAATAAVVDNTALTFLTQVENATFRASGKLYVCKFCCLNVRHYDDLKRHEEKCAKREDATRNPASQQAITPPNSKIPFKKQLLIRSGQDTVHCDQASDAKNDGAVEPLPCKHRCLQPVIESHSSLVQKKHLTLPSILIPACSSNNDSNLQSPPSNANNEPKILPPTATIHLQPYTLTLKSVPSTAILNSAANLSGDVAFLPVSVQDRRKALMTERWCFKSSPIVHSFLFTDPKSSLAHYDPKIPVRAKDSLQNLQWMRSFNLRWRHSFLRYSLAKTRDSMLVTHSTYWKYAQQQLQLQQIQQKSARKHCQELSTRSETQSSILRKKPKIEQTPLVSLSHQKSSLVDVPSRRSSKIENDTTVRCCQEEEAAASSVALAPSDDQKNVAQDHVQHQGHDIFEGCSKRNSEDSDETMSNDGLCVVTDDEDEKCQPGQRTNHLIRELRQGLLTFSRIWTRLLEDRSNERLICQTPAFSDHHIVDFHHNNNDLVRCSSAPPVFYGHLPAAFVDHSVTVNNRKLGSDSRTNHSPISSPSGSGFLGQDSRSEGLKDSNVNASITGDTNGMEVITDSGISDISTPTDSRITPISTGGTSCNVCEFCGQKFEKFSLFVLHRSVHSINRNAHKRYEYRCPYCSSNQRSRNLLQRHIATAHQRLCSQYSNSLTSRGENESAVNGNKGSAAATTSKDHRSTIPIDNRTIFNSGLQQQQASSQAAFNNGATSRTNQPLLNDPRPFKCHYCEIAFRIHGHLAKHLRSKAHVMKLEALSLVPPGALSILEEGDRLSQVDTSDCENSLRSLRKLMEKLNNGSNAQKKKIPQSVAPVPPAPAMLSPRNSVDNNKMDAAYQSSSLDPNGQPPGDSSSLACTESFSVATSPLQDATEKSTGGGGTKRSITASGVWIPPKDVCLPITVPISPVDSSNGGDQAVNNNGHSGSIATIPPQVLNVQTSVLTPRSATDGSANLAFPCRICDGRFYSQLDLDVHYHADHVVMRDGSFFKCPAKDCDTVYPTRLNLRNHLILHYTGRLPCTANNSGFVSSPGENGNGSSTAAASATPSTPEATSNSSFAAVADRTDVSRSTVAALNRKLMSGHCDSVDFNCLNGNGSRKAYCSRSSSAKSHCDCQKCVKQQTDSIDNSPPPDSDASRLSASSRSHSPTPPSRPASKRSLTMTPASCSSSSINNVQMSGGSNGAAASSAIYNNDSLTSMSVFSGAPAKRAKYVNGFYSHHHQQQLQQQQAQLADFAHHAGLQAASPSSFVATPGAFQAAVRSITANQPQAQSPYNLVNVSQLAALNSAISPPTASILAFQQQQQQLAALKSFYNSWGGAAALLPQSLLNAAAVAAAGAANLPATQHVLAQHPSVNAAAASAPVFSLDNLRCIKCARQFYSPMAVQQHIIAEHSEAAPRAHICPFCDAAFTTQHALQAHMPCRMQSLPRQ